MINEHDIKDWDFDQLREDVERLSNETEWSAACYVSYANLHAFIENVEDLLAANKKQVAVLLKAKS